jgi:hypothetical protein
MLAKYCWSHIKEPQSGEYERQKDEVGVQR